jgi:F-type H+-transporting ATPase subunit b
MLFNLLAVTSELEPGTFMGLVSLDATLIFQVVNTLILFGGLTYLLFKPVKQLIEDRQNKIEDELEDAKNKNVQAETLIADYDGKIAKIEEQGREMISVAAQKAELRASDIIKAAEKEADLIKKRAEKEIEREKLKAVNELKEDIVSLSLLAASKILEKDIDQDQHKTMINQFLEEVGDTTWQN